MKSLKHNNNITQVVLTLILNNHIIVQLGRGLKLNTKIGLHTTHHHPPQELF